uniref:Uncharacterized protein n=1 Tax=Timema bartmani TaxID=61472 RepID=A0A7R9F9X8_9NEOP|nr:unnamed protein product [Timema bartmani]
MVTQEVPKKITTAEWIELWNNAEVYEAAETLRERQYEFGKELVKVFMDVKKAYNVDINKVLKEMEGWSGKRIVNSTKGLANLMMSLKRKQYLEPYDGSDKDIPRTTKWRLAPLETSYQNEGTRAESQPMPPVKNVTNSTSQSDKEEWVDSISFYDKHVVDNKEEEYFIDAINDQCLDVADKALFMPGIDKAIYRQLNRAMLNGSMKYPMSEEIYPDRTDAEVRNDKKISLPLPSTVLEGFLPVSVDRRAIVYSCLSPLKFRLLEGRGPLRCWPFNSFFVRLVFNAKENLAKPLLKNVKDKVWLAFSPKETQTKP